MVPGGSRTSEPPPLKDIPRMNLCYEEVFSLLLPQKEKGYCDTRRQMKTKYYELEARYERKCEEVQTNFSSSSSRELDLMFSTLQNWRKTLIAHKREHYSECSQLIFKHATEFDDFVAKYHTAQFKLNFDDSLSRDLQYACHDAYLDLYNGSIDPEMLSEAFWTLVESWDSSRVAIFTDGQTHPDFSQLPSTYDEPRPTATVKALEEVPRTSESSVNDSQMSSAHTRRHSGLSPHESRNRVQTTRSQTPSETPPGLEGSALITLPETPKERIIERSMSIPGLDDWQAQIPFLSGEIREERRTCNPVVNIHIKGEEIPSPDVSAAHILPDPIPISSPIPITPATPNSYPSTPSRKHGSPRVQQEAKRTRDSTSESRNALGRIQMTRSQTRPSSLKPDSVSVPRELQRNTRSSLTDNELSKARKVDSHRKPPSESIMETASAVSHASSMLDSISVPRELHRNPRSSLNKDSEPSKAHNADSRRETATAVSHTSSKLATHVKKRQSSESLMLVQKRPNITHEPTSARTPIFAKSVLEMVSPISRPSLNLGIKPSNRTVLTPFPKCRDVKKQSIGKAEVSLTKGTNSAKRLPAPRMVSLPSKPSPVVISLTRASSICPSKDKAAPPFPVVPKRRASNVVSTKHVVNSNTTYRLSETLSRVSNGSSVPPSSENVSSPVAGEVPLLVEPKGELSRSPKFHERSAERSTRFQRLVSERVPIPLLLDEIGEKRRIYDTVINIQINKSEDNAPEATTTSALPFSTSLPSLILPTSTVSAPPPTDEPSPIEVAPIRRVLTIVNKKSSASELHSPYPGTVRRQSQNTSIPSSYEEGQLASAAAYIRERMNRRSLTHNESIRCSPAVPPDKIANPDSDSRRLETRVVNKETEMSITIRSPVSEGPESPLVRPDASLQQHKTRRAEELSSEHSEAIPWLPEPVFDEASIRRQRSLHAINNVDMDMNPRSPVPNTALTPLYSSKSAYPTQAHPSVQPRSQQCQLKPSEPPKVLRLGGSQRCSLNIVNTKFSLSAIWYSPKPESGPSPFLSETGRSSQQKPSELPVSRLGSSKRCPLDIVNTKSDLSTSLYSPKSMAVFTPPIPKRASQPVPFGLGCNLAMLSTMMQVLCVITFGAIPNREAKEMQYTIIHEYFEDDRTTTSAPPYASIDTGATANAVPFLPPEPSWWAETPGSACVERIWRARCKPPNIAVDSRRQNYSVVNKTFNSGDEYSPLYRAVRILPKPSNLIRVNHLRLRRLLNIDASQFTSILMRPPRHRRSVVSFVVQLLWCSRLDSEG